MPDRLRIVNDDGVGHKTRIYVGDVEISHVVQSVEWRAEAGELTTAIVRCVDVEIDGVTEARMVVVQGLGLDVEPFAS